MPNPTNKAIMGKLTALEGKVDNMDQALRSEIGSLGSIVMSLQGKEHDREVIENFKKQQMTRLTPIYKDPKVLQIILYFALALLLLVAAVTRFDVSRVL